MSSKTGIEQLRAIEEQFDRECGAVSDPRSLEEIRNRYLSRKSGILTIQLQSLKDLPAGQRAEFGKTANQLKGKIESALATLETAIQERERTSAIRSI